MKRNAIAVYSLRKWGPFPDLGMVLCPSSNGSAQHGDWVEKGYDAPFVLWKLWGVILRALFFAWPVDALGRYSLQVARHGEALLDRRVQIRRASPISRLLWRFWNWREAWRARRQ